MKGIFSVDAFAALLLMLFSVLLMQGLIGLSFDNSNSFGANYEAKAEAIRVGSIMNTFYSTKPGANDRVKLNSSSARTIRDPTSNFTFSLSSGVLNATLMNRFSNKSYLYQVAAVNFSSDWVVSR